MAKSEYRLRGSFDRLLEMIHKGILSGSVSATYEEGSDWQKEEFRCAVRVYERYSVFGGNRVSLNVMIAGRDDSLFLSAITSGGSQAVFFKMNTLGEAAFLDCLDGIAEAFRRETE